MLNLAKNDPRIRVDDYGAVFDTHPELVNFWNGTFDLNTGELREHRREDYLTKIVKYDFAEDIVSPRWESFVEHTFGELAGAVQTCAGYSFTGYVNEKCVFFLIGPTNTGKTTFLTALREVFRQYTAEIMVSSLMHSRLNSEGNNTLADLADLCGARFAVTSETEEGQRLHEAKLKRLAQGMGTIRTARKYEKPFSFPATHKLWVDANHRPVITGTDDAIWNRLICIPCPNVVRNPNKNLLAEMVAEAPGIISWVIQGMKRWLKEGLQIPDELRAARDEWRSNSDRMGDWLDECCTLNPEAWTASEILFDSWKPWCEKRRIEPGGMPSFITKLIDRGFRSERRRVGGGSSPKVRGVWGIQPPTTSFG
jgi:putative DNA primase/helicase